MGGARRLRRAGPLRHGASHSLAALCGEASLLHCADAEVVPQLEPTLVAVGARVEVLLVHGLLAAVHLPHALAGVALLRRAGRSGGDGGGATPSATAHGSSPHARGQRAAEAAREARPRRRGAAEPGRSVDASPCASARRATAPGGRPQGGPRRRCCPYRSPTWRPWPPPARRAGRRRGRAQTPSALPSRLPRASWRPRAGPALPRTTRGCRTWPLGRPWLPGRRCGPGGASARQRERRPSAHQRPSRCDDELLAGRAEPSSLADLACCPRPDCAHTAGFPRPARARLPSSPGSSGSCSAPGRLRLGAPAPARTRVLRNGVCAAPRPSRPRRACRA